MVSTAKKNASADNPGSGGRGDQAAVLAVREKISKGVDRIVTGWGLAIGVLWVVISFLGFSQKGASFFWLWVLLTFACFILFALCIFGSMSLNENHYLRSLSKSQRQIYDTIEDSNQKSRAASNKAAGHRMLHGDINEKLTCPHCQTSGSVRSTKGQDVTSTKVVPVIGNNIKSRKMVTKRYCDNCNTSWSV